MEGRNVTGVLMKNPRGAKNEQEQRLWEYNKQATLKGQTWVSWFLWGLGTGWALPGLSVPIRRFSNLWQTYCPYGKSTRRGVGVKAQLPQENKLQINLCNKEIENLKPQNSNLNNIFAWIPVNKEGEYAAQVLFSKVWESWRGLHSVDLTPNQKSCTFKIPLRNWVMQNLQWKIHYSFAISKVENITHFPTFLYK